MPMIRLRRGHGVRPIAIAPPQLAVALQGRMRIDDETLANGEMFAIPRTGLAGSPRSAHRPRTAPVPAPDRAPVRVEC
jgi:hypothetical protein